MTRLLLTGSLVALFGLSGASAQPPTPKQPPAKQAAQAIIEVRLPPNAELSFDGYRTRQRGPVRRFVSSPLEPGYTYSYELVATWADKDGKPSKETKNVEVRAGETSRVELGMAEKKGPPKDKDKPKVIDKKKLTDTEKPKDTGKPKETEKPKDSEKAKAGGVIKLFNGKDLSGWTIFLDPKKKADPKDVWSVKDGVIVCQGMPFGYILTDKEYDDYVLKVEWRWGEKVHNKTGVRNSGVFVHVVGPDKIWPKAIEAQLMADHAGDFWLVDNFKLDVDPKRQDPNPKLKRHYLRMLDNVERPIGEWNQYEITCKGDTIKLVINGKLVNEGKNAEITRGKILLQSEGAEIHFRNVTLQLLTK